MSVSLSRSQHLWKSKSDLSLHTTRYPYDDDHHEQQTEALPLEPPELYHPRSRYSAAHGHSIRRPSFESMTSLVQAREAPIPPPPSVETVTEPPQPQLPTGSKLFILVTCTCVAVFLQALVSIPRCCSKLFQTSCFRGYENKELIGPRIQQSSPQPFPT